MLPGKLTVKHIEAAEARGQSFIRYMKKDWTLEELYELAGVRRTSRKSKVDKKLVSGRVDSSDGKESEPDRNVSESKSRTWKEPESDGA